MDSSAASKRGHTVDGIVLTEHRKFDFDKDYSELASQYNVVVLKGSELDTRYGHFLVYGVTQALTPGHRLWRCSHGLQSIDAGRSPARRHCPTGPPWRLASA